MARRLRWAPFALASLVAIARLYIGVHLPLDVVGGAALGIAVGGLANIALGTPTATADGPDTKVAPRTYCTQTVPLKRTSEKPYSSNDLL